MQGKLGDRIRLLHVIDAISEIELYLIDTDFSNFINNSMMRFACIKQIEIIGEASNHISDEIKLKFTAINWSQIIGMRNVLLHEYFGVDSSLVWEIIKNDLPILKNKIKEILNAIE